MVFLKKIYSNPKGLFDPVEFHNGINIIYGEKNQKSKQQDSLNGIGKSTLIDLINFCLLSNIPQRLKRAKDFLKEYYIILEFEVNKKEYKLARSIAKPNEIYFGDTKKMLSYKKDDIKRTLSDLFFKDENRYNGYYSNEWFRKLLPFFIKVQQKGKQTYKDVLTYLEGAKVVEIIQYHLFLLGIDNTLAKENYQLKSELKQREGAIKEIKKFIEETYGLKDIQDANNRISNLNNEIKKLNDSIEIFKLGPQYDTVEAKANELTKFINEALIKSHVIKRKITDYNKSLTQKTKVRPSEIARVYQEINEELGLAVKKTLEQAIEFKNQLISSRKDFISEEIVRLEGELKDLEQKISNFDKERAKLFAFLDEKEAIKDLTNAFYLLNKKKEETNDLTSKLKTYNDFQHEIMDLKENEAKLNKKIVEFVINIQEGIDQFRTVFNNFYNIVYVKQKDQALFNISHNFKKDAKFELKIDAPDIYSEGKNRGCILLYDLSVLFNAIETERQFPGFLIHDGIFDGIHKSHFVALMNNLDRRSIDENFQYIFTSNKEDIYIKEALNCGELTFDINSKAVAIYSPNNKLFNRDF